MTFGVAFESVLDAAKVGAPWAWSAIYREIAGPVTGFFRSRGVGDPEDATGDVFFELSRELERFSGTEESFVTLVFAIAYRRLLIDDRHPTRNARSALADRVLDQLQHETEIVIDDSDPEITPTIRAALEALGPEQRDVISLRVIAGLTIEQTAQVIGTSVEAVKTAQRKGLARIRGTMPHPVVLS